MKHLHLKEWESTDEEAGEPAEAAEPVIPSDVRYSGVRLRGERVWPDGGSAPSAPAIAEAPCRSFEDICRRYTHFIWTRSQRWWIKDADAKDILQNVLVAMYTRTHDQGMPAEAEVTLVLLRMIAEETRRLRRKAGRNAQKIDGEVDPDTQPSSKPDPEQMFARAEGCDDAKPKVEMILARMSEDASEVFELIDIDGCSPQEVATMLNRPVGRIAVQIHRARARFWDLAARIYNVRQEGST